MHQSLRRTFQPRLASPNNDLDGRTWLIGRACVIIGLLPAGRLVNVLRMPGEDLRV